MGSALVRAPRGILAAVSLLAFVGRFFAIEARVTSSVLVGLAGIGTATLLATVGFSEVRRLLGLHGPPGNDAGDVEDAAAEGTVEDDAAAESADPEGTTPTGRSRGSNPHSTTREIAGRTPRRRGSRTPPIAAGSRTFQYLLQRLAGRSAHG